jgi:Mg-chelatase subunit ChlD
MTRISRLLLFTAAALFMPVLQPKIAGSANASTCVDVALVLTVDASASVSREEFALQQQGIAAAFRDSAVLDAMSAAGRVAVSIIFWGSEGLAKPQSAWILVENAEAAESFARTVEAMPRGVTGDTGLGAGLLAALQKFESLEQCAVRKVVNVSGDGEETRVFRRKRNSPAPVQVRDLAQSSNVEINALAISNEEKYLADYYADNVITGPDAFVMQVARYEDLATSLRRKLIREIGPRMVSERSPHQHGPSGLN